MGSVWAIRASKPIRGIWKNTGDGFNGISRAYVVVNSQCLVGERGRPHQYLYTEYLEFVITIMTYQESFERIERQLQKIADKKLTKLFERNRKLGEYKGLAIAYQSHPLVQLFRKIGLFKGIPEIDLRPKKW